jgi:hypothetical protein
LQLRAENQSNPRYNVHMRRWLSVSALGLILLALPVWAQRHGGGGGGSHFSSSGAHSNIAFRAGSSGSFSRGSSIHGSSGIRVRTGNPYYNRGVYRRGYYPYFPYGSYYPYGYYGWDNSIYDDSGDQDAYAANAAPAYSGPYADDSGLQRDVQALNGKIDRLQADVEARNRPKQEEPATALVFRDQHVEEVHNYAIAGGTLWVLNDQAAKKIPLAQLDLPATVKMNDDRGVDFQIPQ